MNREEAYIWPRGAILMQKTFKEEDQISSISLKVMISINFAWRFGNNLLSSFYHFTLDLEEHVQSAFCGDKLDFCVLILF